MPSSEPEVVQPRKWRFATWATAIASLRIDSACIKKDVSLKCRQWPSCCAPPNVGQEQLEPRPFCDASDAGCQASAFVLSTLRPR